MILNEMSECLKHRIRDTEYRVILAMKDINGKTTYVRYWPATGLEDAINTLKGRFNQAVGRIDVPAENKMLDVDNLCGWILYKNGETAYIDVEVTTTFINRDNVSKQQTLDAKKMYDIMSLFAMTEDVRIRKVIAKHTDELSNGQECSIKLTYKEVDKRGNDGKYAGHDLYYVDDVSIPDWVYCNLRSIFMEEK